MEEDLYTEDFYGDYDDTFVPPVPVTTPRNANPFGVAINFDDYKLSDIRNVEYEYDYDEYEDTAIETNEVGDGDADVSPDAINETENTLTPPRTVSQSHPSPHLNTNPHDPRFNPTQLQYMGMVNRPHKPRHQHKQKQPSRQGTYSGRQQTMFDFNLFCPGSAQVAAAWARCPAWSRRCRPRWSCC